jgi:hypothetical protein
MNIRDNINLINFFVLLHPKTIISKQVHLSPVGEGLQMTNSFAMNPVHIRTK